MPTTLDPPAASDGPEKLADYLELLALDPLEDGLDRLQASGFSIVALSTDPGAERLGPGMSVIATVHTKE